MRTVAPGRWLRGQPSKAAENRHRSERDVEEEHPAPTELLSEQPADKRAECGSDIRDSVEGTDCGGPMITGDRVADRRHAYGEQRRGTQALHSPESNQ
jgi:hypothetical protein